MAGYSIGKVARMTGLTAHTLRYYDKEGLLPFVQKSASGARSFSDQDLEWLGLIECLKGVGMPIKDIKQYIDWYREGDSTIGKRLDMFKRQKEHLEEQMALLRRHLEKIDYKIEFYTDAAEHGNMDVLSRNERLREKKKRIFGDIGEKKEAASKTRRKAA